MLEYRIPGRSRHVWRLLAAVALASIAALQSVGIAGASVILRERYAGEDAFSYNDCGFWVDVEAEFSGVAHIRVGKGPDASAFFLHDNFAFHEVHTARDSGTSIEISGNGIFQETKAVRVDGNVFAFTSVNAGQPFVVRDSDGTLLLRDRGVIRETILFDTLGDDTPGGEFIDSVDFQISGPHPGFFTDVCALLD